MKTLDRFPRMVICRLAILLALLIGGLLGPCLGATEKRGDVIILPVYNVSAKDYRPWLYAEAPGVVVLSRLERADTEAYIAELGSQLRLLSLLLPPDYDPRTSQPFIVILDDRAKVISRAAQIVRNRKTYELSSVSSLRKDGDAGMLFVQTSEKRSKSMVYGDVLIMVNYHRSLLQPRLPVWADHPIGMRVTFPVGYLDGREVIGTLPEPPREGVNLETGEVTYRDREPLRPLADLLTLAPDQGAAPHEDLCELAQWFCAWGLMADRGAHRAGFWALARQSVRSTATPEELVQSCLQMSMEEVDASLKKYRDARWAVRNKWDESVMGAHRATRLQFSKLRVAQADEIARCLGEWSRVTIAQNIQPVLADELRKLGKATAEQAIIESSSDPRIYGILGLLELQAGERKSGLANLEKAVSGNVQRPLCYLALAQEHYDSARRLVGSENESVGMQETREALALCVRALSYTPKLPEAYDLMADILSSSSLVPSEEQIALLRDGVSRFPREAEFLLNAARTLEKAKCYTDAEAAAKQGLKYARAGSKTAAALQELCDRGRKDGE